MARRFMFVCFGILALATAYAVGADNSVAQVGGSNVVHSFNGNGGALCVVTADGDIYGRAGFPENGGSGIMGWSQSGEWTHLGNVFSGAVGNQQRIPSAT
ncbi:MAG: hypothetical protein IPG61_09645 [bacterium]|nr:hypothetical protein [bacterium]